MKLLALDIGGSFIKYGWVQDGTASALKTIPTNAQLGPQALLDTITAIVSEFPKTPALGISFASQTDPVRGCITSATDTFPGFTGVPLRDILQQRLGIPVAVDNDVNCAAFAEGRWGAAAGKQDFLCLTYGTGIGGALVLDGKLYYGQAFAAGEVGHMTLHGGGIRCNCGRLGCYEAYASVSALTARVSASFPQLCSGKDICAAYEAGLDGLAPIVDSWMQDVVDGLCSCMHLLNPSTVVLGGGIMENRFVFQILHSRLQQALLPNFRQAQILPAQLGNAAGMIGAALLAEQLL